jgi:hypothetical protein
LFGLKIEWMSESFAGNTWVSSHINYESEFN